MKIYNNLVFFEDNDTIQQIQSFYKEISKRELVLRNLEGGNKDVNVDINDVIEDINKIKFTNLTKDEVQQIKKLLKKEGDSLNRNFQDIFNLKLTAGLSLIDYLIRKNKEFPHEFKYVKNETKDYVGFFVGEMKHELYEMQSAAGCCPISFYISVEIKSLPILDFNQTFNNNINVIREYFLEDILVEDFDSIVEEYLKFKKKNT